MSDDLSGDMLAPSWPNLVCMIVDTVSSTVYEVTLISCFISSQVSSRSCDELGPVQSYNQGAHACSSGPALPEAVDSHPGSSSRQVHKEPQNATHGLSVSTQVIHVLSD